MDLLIQAQVQVTEVVPIGVVQEGVRMDVRTEGRVLEGLLEGFTLKAVDYFLLRSNGVGVVDVHQVLSLDQIHLATTLAGYTYPAPGMEMPPPEVFLSPDYVWPDRSMPMVGSIRFATGAEQWRDLNQTFGVFEGWANLYTREMSFRARAVPVPASAQ